MVVVAPSAVCYGRFLEDGNLGDCRPDFPWQQQSRRHIDRDLDAGIVAGVIHPSNPIISTAILRAEQRIQENRDVQTRLEAEIAALHSQLDDIPRALDAAEQALAGCLGSDSGSKKESTSTFLWPELMHLSKLVIQSCMPASVQPAASTRSRRMPTK